MSEENLDMYKVERKQVMEFEDDEKIQRMKVQIDKYRKKIFRDLIVKESGQSNVSRPNEDFPHMDVLIHYLGRSLHLSIFNIYIPLSTRE